MEEEKEEEHQWPASETLFFFPYVFLFILQTKLAIVFSHVFLLSSQC